LADARARNLVMVCANSDYIAISEGKGYYCGGALAKKYDQLGGTCFHYGKPHSSIYETCITTLPEIAPDRILAIGDSFETDMPGARDANIDSVFIAGGVHATELETSPSDGLRALCIDTNCQPRAAMKRLRW